MPRQACSVLPLKGRYAIVESRDFQEMLLYAAKVLITSLLVVAVVELAKRSSFWAALLPSLPCTALIAFVWLYLDTGSTSAVAKLSTDIFWLILASLALFTVLPVMLKAGWPFWPSFGLACAATVAAYAVIIAVMNSPYTRG
jgi:hypothetical protein